MFPTVCVHGRPRDELADAHSEEEGWDLLGGRATRRLCQGFLMLLHQTGQSLTLIHTTRGLLKNNTDIEFI